MPTEPRPQSGDPSIKPDDNAIGIISTSQQHNSNEDFSSHVQQHNQASHLSRRLITATIYASISGLLFGYQLGITSGALQSLQSSLELTSSQKESVTSFFFLGLMIASLFGGEACDRFGRRKSILYTDGVFGLASMMLLVAPGIKIILMGRFISGCASGIALVSAVSYLTEIASGDHLHRGSLVSTVEASSSLGFLLAYLTSYLMLKFVDTEESWRLLFGLGTGFLSLVQWMGFRKMPESPDWLVQMGFHGKADEAVRWIGVADSYSVKARQDGHSHQDFSSEYRRRNFFSHETCPSISQYWRQVIIIAFLAMAEQFCGHINVMNYAPVIFAEAFFDYDEEQATEDEAVATELLSTTIILGIVKLIVTTFVLFEVDRLGRLFLMKAGAGLVSVSLFCLAIGFSVNLESADENDSGDVEYQHTSFQKAMVLIGCTGGVAGYSLSYGPITWLLASELSPASIRGRMLGFYTVLTHGSAALVSYTFLSGQEKYSDSAPFWLYFICSMTSLLFIVLAVPETGNVDDGEVDVLLDELWFWGEDNPLNCCTHPALDCRRCNKRRNITNGEEIGRINSCFANGGIDQSQHNDIEFV